MTIEKYWVNQLHLSNKNYPSEFTRVQVVKLSDVLAKLEEFEKDKILDKDGWADAGFPKRNDIAVIERNDWNKLKSEIGGDK